MFEFVHWTHWPALDPLVTQAGAVAEPHALGEPDPKSPSQARQAPPVQTGLDDGQPAFVRHSTQVFVVVLHFGVEPVQFESLRHCTHWLVAVLHTGVRPEQFVSDEQPAVQRFVELLQMPLTPVPHWAFVRHCTHSLLVVLHTGSPGRVSQTELLPDLHSTHAPDPMQAGVSALGQAKAVGVGLPLSTVQPTHALAAVLQMGLVPVQADVFAAVHSTQRLVDVLHTDLPAPLQRSELFALHSTHAPVERLQAGDLSDGHAAPASVPLSPLQGTQRPPGLQTGLRPPQFVFDLHSTHLLAFVSQNGLLVPVHCRSEVHSTHVPLGPHTGVACVPTQLALVVQLEVQVLLDRSQNGVEPEHCAFERHWTQVFVETLQTLVEPHAVESVSLHSLQLPPTHAGWVAR